MRPEAPESSSARAAPPLAYVLRAVLASFALIALLRFVYEVRIIVVMVLFGALFSLVLVYPIDWLARVMPRSLAALLTLVLIVGVWILLALLSAPFIGAQVEWLVDHMPAAMQQVRAWVEHLAQLEPRLFAGLREPLGRELGQVLRQVVPVALNAVSVLLSGVAVLALALFFAYGRDQTQRALLRLVPRQHEDVASQFLSRAGRALQHWILGQLLSMIIIGILTAAGMALLGLGSWLVLGAITGVFEFIPYIGAWLAAIPAIATGLAVSPELALWVVLLYTTIHIIEGYLLQPVIMRRAIRIEPALQLVTQLSMGKAFGFVGVFVSTPLLACAYVAVEYFYIERRLGKPGVEQEHRVHGGESARQ